MRPYEVMVIIEASADDEVINATIDKATKTIKSHGGNPGKVDRWGKRRFAYELHHRTEGYYALIEASAEPEAMHEVDRVLRLADEVVRHKVILLPEKVAGKARRPAKSDSEPAAASANGA